MVIYTITDWLGLVPIFIALGFAILGLSQLIKRKSLCKVDLDILVLGGFYVIVMAFYILFEIYAVNFRPVLINGPITPKITSLAESLLIPFSI